FVLDLEVHDPACWQPLTPQVDVPPEAPYAWREAVLAVLEGFCRENRGPLARPSPSPWHWVRRRAPLWDGREDFAGFWRELGDQAGTLAGRDAWGRLLEPSGPLEQALNRAAACVPDDPLAARAYFLIELARLQAAGLRPAGERGDPCRSA